MSIFKKILLILKGVLIIMSKFAQIFSTTRPVYKLDEKSNVLIKTDDVVDIQEEVNSCYDETMYSRLESYFESNNQRVIVSDDVADDYDSYGNAFEEYSAVAMQIDELRDRYGLPKNLFSDAEVLATVRDRLVNSVNIEEGGTENAKGTQQTSQQEKLPEADS